ncbi:MAG TPA: OmpA family protein [Candidatus Acidoferrales bacterium]|jgi:peptidoglycan-associated lipoprotein|nr:OmpA family protein [Candidatus Acidoferrales bacterium]
MTNSRKLTLPLVLATISVFGAACAKKKVAAAPPPAPQPAAEAPRSNQVQQQPTRAEATPTPATSVAPSSRTPNAATRARIDELLAKIEDAYFDYNQHTLRPDAVKALQADSSELRDILKDFPDYKLTIEGHADERGSAEYNMALGDERAHAAKDYLVQVGIPGDQLHVMSYGKERPVCEEHDENCWQKNRRIHIVAGATQ